MAGDEILIPLQPLISCFLKSLVICGSGSGCPRVSQRLCCALVPVAQAGGGSSVLNLLCAKDQANENCEHRSGI